MRMNILETEAPVRLVAKTCGCKDKKKNKVTYSVVDSYHNLCLDKKDIFMRDRSF